MVFFTFEIMHAALIRNENLSSGPAPSTEYKVKLSGYVAFSRLADLACYIGVPSLHCCPTLWLKRVRAPRKSPMLPTPLYLPVPLLPLD